MTKQRDALAARLKTADKLQDSLLRHSLQHGFSLGQTDDEANFKQSVEAYSLNGETLIIGERQSGRGLKRDLSLNDLLSSHKMFFAALSCSQCVMPSTSFDESGASIKEWLGKSFIKFGTRTKSCTVSAHSYLFSNG